MLNLITIVILGAAVVLRGDSIVAVGRRGQVKIPADAQVIDARGMVVSPGFIDSHNHFDRGHYRSISSFTSITRNHDRGDRTGWRLAISCR